MKTLTAVKSKPIHKSILTPRRVDLAIIRFLILIGIILLAQFVYWYFNDAHIGNRTLYWILTIAFGYKMLHLVYEWYYLAAISVPKAEEVTHAWTVDMLTTYVPGEPYDMIVETLTAMVNVRYPHTSYLCDEGNDPYLKQVCEELGVVHVYRGKDKTGAKAGNINYTLRNYATGELCIIMDPDHVPVPEFIDQVLPYFEDSQVGYVQCIQGYSNHDESFIARGAAEQTYLFYGPMMMGMQGRGTVQAIGANCTFRREALDSIGGHATGLCEDMHTSMQLHAKKWTSVYVPELLTRGRVPSSVSAYFQQQLKWTRGCFELLFEVYPKLFKKFNWRQRLHYFLTPLYFLYGIIGLIDLGVPIISLFSFQVPLFIELEVFFLRILPVLLCSILIRHYVQRYVLEQHEEGFHVIGGVLRVSTWWVYLVGFVYSILRIKVPYIPTPKEGEWRNDWKISLPNIIVITLSAAAIIYGLRYDRTPFTWMMAGFAGVNIVILGAMVLAAQQKMIARFFTYLKQETFSIIDQYWAYFRYRLVYRIIRSTTFAVIIAILALSTSSLNFANIHSSVFLNRLSTLEEKQLGWTLDTWNAQEGWIKNSPANLSLEQNGNVEKVKMQAFAISDWKDRMADDFAYILNHSTQNSIIPFIHWKLSELEFDWACRSWSDPLPVEQQQVLNQLSDLFVDYEKPAILYVELKTELPGEDIYLAKENAYQLIYQQFKTRGASNLTLAWQYSPDTKNDFPGKQYVDLVVLPKQKNLDLQSIKQKTKNLNLPVLLTVNNANEFFAQQTTARYLVKEKIPVIGFLQYSNYAVLPVEVLISEQEELLHPSYIQPEENKNTAFVNLSSKGNINPAISHTPQGQHQWLVDGQDFYMKGVAYNPRHNWRDGNWYPTRRTLEKDFDKIKAMGANTLSWYESNTYDKNVLKVAAEKKLKVVYNFWLDPKIDYFDDFKKRKSLKKKILQRVNNYRNYNTIIAWNLGVATWSELENHFHQPYLTEVRRAYVQFINEVSLEIKRLDASRPIMAGIDGSREIAGTLHNFHTFAPAVDIMGISGYNETQLNEVALLMRTKYRDLPYVISEFGAKINGEHLASLVKENKQLVEPSSFEKARLYAKLWSSHIEANRGNNMGGIAYCWRDRYEGTATLSGIMDLKGHLKPTYFSLKEVWTGQPQTFPLADLHFKAETRYEQGELQLCFTALSPNTKNTDLTYEWYICEGEYLYRLEEVIVDRKNRGFKYKLSRKIHQYILKDYSLEQYGTELRYYNRLANATQRIYLHIYDRQGHVVTASQPIYTTFQ